MDSREMFMAALTYIVDTAKLLTQKEISDKSGIQRQTINHILRGSKPAGLSVQERIAGACGYSLLEFLTYGKSIIEGGGAPAEEQESPPSVAPQVGARVPGLPFINHQASPVTSAMAAVTSLVDEYTAMEKKYRFFLTAFESHPDPMCIVKDGIVIMQNQRSKAWGVLAGSPLCHNCMDGKCDMTCSGAVCAIRESQRHGVPAKKYKDTVRGQAIVSCAPMVFDGEEYYIVTMTLQEELPVRDLREGNL